MNDFYVYALLDPRYEGGEHCGYLLDSFPRYIGKGRASRIQSSATYGTNPEKRQWLSELRASGLRPETVILEQGLDEQQAFDLECRYIEELGRVRDGSGCLVNATVGGEGKLRVTDEEREAYKKLLKGTGFKIVEKMYGMSRYQKHTCTVHGEVLTAPHHVVARLKRRAPACPKCSEVARGAPQAATKNRLNTERYSTWFEQNCPGYKIVGDYKNAVTRISHACPNHGTFLITPANVKQKHGQGLTCCPKCNVENQVHADGWTPERRAKDEAVYRQLLKSTFGFKFKLVGAYSTEHTNHVCRVHGQVFNSPNVVRSNIKRGLSGCPECNREQAIRKMVARNRGETPI